ncbi:MAG: glycosyltransferase family 2 protein [Rhodothermales bacterium]|nr:glycosyltransferase family 2 protein [Rhodothermales bacterium]MBO6780607.1 glycosyltransferase family 2 protein [Rhodothermales bacterium]
MKPQVSVIIVSWNARHLLERCLPSVVATAYENVEVVLADNGSTDDSVTWVRQHHPSVRVIEHGSNLGFCAGNNRAIEQTDSPYVVLLNNDVEVEPDWLDHLIDEAEAQPKVAALQPKVLQFDERHLFEYAGAAGGHLDRFAYPFARGRIFFDLEEDLGQYDEPADVFWATGAAMLLRRSALDTVGLLDEAFEFHMEEIDLCWRLQRAGFRVRAVPASKVYHMGGSSLAQGSPRKTRYNFRNSLLMLYKNLPPAEFRRAFAGRLVLDSLAVIRFLLRGEWRSATAVISAFAQAHRMKSFYEPAPPGQARPSFHGSIAWHYYARRRISFSQLPPERLQVSR